jgi:hypothetical protein
MRKVISGVYFKKKGITNYDYQIETDGKLKGRRFSFTNNNVPEWAIDQIKDIKIQVWED